MLFERAFDNVPWSAIRIDHFNMEHFNTEPFSVAIFLVLLASVVQSAEWDIITNASFSRWHSLVDNN